MVGRIGHHSERPRLHRGFHSPPRSSTYSCVGRREGLTQYPFTTVWSALAGDRGPMVAKQLRPSETSALHDPAWAPPPPPLLVRERLRRDGHRRRTDARPGWRRRRQPRLAIPRSGREVEGGSEVAGDVAPPRAQVRYARPEARLQEAQRRGVV